MPRRPRQRMHHQHRQLGQGDAPAACIEGSGYAHLDAFLVARFLGGFDGGFTPYTSRYCYGLVANFARSSALARSPELRLALAMGLDKEGIIREALGGSEAGKTIGVLGLTFKPETDDIREAPALEIISKLTAMGASVIAYDPEAMPNVKREYKGELSFADNQYGALDGADALIICTEWNEFRTPDFDKIIKGLKAKVIFDGRNLYDPATMKSLGFYYDSVGRITINQ